ncbi:MAG: FAD-dependent oxidoreductase [Acidobacteria bacterium]|nr:MAG: FAD-dependent oxidoreductase [Acidobacteriota bacterium]
MSAFSSHHQSVVIIGAGPAGLTAAAELSEHGVAAVVVEADDAVGGLARTVNYKGYLFDIGGHRFFTKWEVIQRFWQRILREEFLERPRMSRIYYRKKFFSYPLRPADALRGVGLLESLLILSSYLRSRLFPHRGEESLEQWVSNRFGKRLYKIFFKTYTEKVWGVPCAEIQAEWAAQRIKQLSLGTAIRNAFLRTNGTQAKTLIDHFHYPKRGPGQMWETLTALLEQKGYPVLRQRRVVRVCRNDRRVTRLVTCGPHGEEYFEGTHFISSIPMRDLIMALDPPAPDEIQEAARLLRYRDFLIVTLIVNRKDVMPDNWIYVHDPQVRVGRIQNFKNWSLAMVPDANKTSLGMEYFVFQNDALWASPDGSLLALAKRELVQLGLARADEIEDGTVVRMPKAYPMYDRGWETRVKKIRLYLDENLPDVQLVGRNGMHRYNNQDHSMMTGLCAARNILGARYDLWAINAEPEYHEDRIVDAGVEPHQPAYAEPPLIERVHPASALPPN